ncbi:MAG: GlxA family transcriptional regulator [Rhodobacter sp.]|nr:GlxA family transcriptional regulator [Rhodobacter sp.]MCA3513077.1 GlxA family transcriptional regulator [Rhodobacter sp.]MCA3520294.1 GlxA family transcriptional regulator [Rhodobacter sp.]MCA3522179.1 GlxA family transcriptional regulator [Rhodobacter sp.]MCA3525918.1 GlxA family transcriptional regulator [Rhodobacter sp.]
MVQPARPVTPVPPPRLRIGFILARRFTLCAFASFVDVLRLAADEGDRSRPILCRWRVLSASSDPVESSCGIKVSPEDRFGDPRQFDYIAVVGGLIGEIESLDPRAVDYLQQAAALGVPLVGICTGAFILHRAGLMNGYRACVSWFHHDDYLEAFEGLLPVSDQIFVVDRDRLTCSGGVTSAQLAAFLVDRHIGSAAARKALAIMIIDEAMRAERPQPGLPLELTTHDDLVKRALLTVQQTIDTPLTVKRLAERLGVSRRRLERHFMAALGLGPQEAGRKVRLALARNLLRHTDRTVSQIAAETGFADASHLIRAFRAEFGETPELWRLHQRNPGAGAGPAAGSLS